MPKTAKRAPKPPADPLPRIREIVAALPDTKETVSHGAPTWWVKKRTFLMFLDNHHGDGRVAVWVAATLDEQETLVGSDPEVFFVPPYVGVGGWVGIRLDRGLDWGVVASLIAEGHRLIRAKQTRRSV